jgi:hypothetical protein
MSRLLFASTRARLCPKAPPRSSLSPLQVAAGIRGFLGSWTLDQPHCVGFPPGKLPRHETYVITTVQEATASTTPVVNITYTSELHDGKTTRTSYTTPVDGVTRIALEAPGAATHVLSSFEAEAQTLSSVATDNGGKTIVTAARRLVDDRSMQVDMVVALPPDFVKTANFRAVYRR